MLSKQNDKSEIVERISNASQYTVHFTVNELSKHIRKILKSIHEYLNTSQNVFKYKTRLNREKMQKYHETFLTSVNPLCM